MKYFLLTMFAFFLNISMLFAQDFSGIKICINPGHGGHDSNDRYISETGFWESDGNLNKGLYLKEILEGFNADVVMTRETNTTADDLPLSQIVAIANTNNVDYFHSIHSNAFNGQSNYTLVLFQGFDNAPTYPESKVMGQYVANEINRAHRTTNKYVRGDFDFYGSGKPYLGVFKGLNMPGTLSEGSFHDYIPESFRLRNLAYTKHEAWSITKAFIDYFGLNKIQTGLAAGIIRDSEKNVSYYSIPGTGDGKAPVNNIHVKIEPGNLTYTGDDYNNGFFLFDSLAPGDYKLVFEKEGYITDSSTVHVSANSTSFADKYLTYDTTIAPYIIYHYPANSTDSVLATSIVKISFSRIMNTSETENAFSINPQTAGSFSWEDENKTLVFTPDLTYEKSTLYTVTLNNKASSKWNIQVDSSYSFQFITKSKNVLSFMGSYPENDQVDISPSVQIRLYFESPLFYSSLSGNIGLYSSSFENLAVKNVRIFQEDGRGIIYFEPTSQLNFNSTYYVILGPGIKDINQLPLKDSVKVKFTVEPEHVGSGFILNDFESLEGWSIESSGIYLPNTNLGLESNQQVSGKYSGNLKYEFSGDSNGVIILSNKFVKSVSGEDSIKFGAWIFGDNSINYIEYSFSNDSLSNNYILADTLNWTGWKFKDIDIVSLSNSSGNLFYKFIIKQNPSGAKNGNIYIDDIQYESTATPVEDKKMLPGQYLLYQNYPNPFNPSTVIRYQVPKRSFVELKVFDILGNEVATLVKGEKSKGIHSVTFSGIQNGKTLSSGIYFYRLKAGEFTSIKKFILLK